MKTTIRVLSLVLGLTVALPSLAAGAPQAEPAADATASNPDMKRIFDADQADRAVDITKMDWAVVGPRDAKRRHEVQRLLAEGRLHTGADFVAAALVFQHGSSSDDFLLAHTLAVIGTKKGDASGPWIAAATLDRYLQIIGQKQIYGTQMSSRGSGWTRDPYNSELISDALRRELNVPDLAGQAQQLEQRIALGTPETVVTPLADVSAPQSGSIKCDHGPVSRVFVRTPWQLFSCGNGELLVVDPGPPTGTVFVTSDGVRVSAEIMGGNEAEARVAKAAFEAMTPDQLAEIVAQTKAVKP